MKRILLFPGAFNPPHVGHINVLETVLEKEVFDEVWIIPSGNRDDKAISISYEDRRNLGNLFVDFLRTKILTPIKLITDELDDAAKRPTQEILAEIKSQADIQTIQLIGSDGMANLKASSDEEIKSEDFIIVQRDASGISSTRIRTMIENGDISYKDLLPDKIADYIEVHKLYQTK